MGRFLAGANLSVEIRELLKGRNVRCAVAFWGMGAGELLSATDPNDIRIVCDVHMGGTSAKALTELGAPTNKALRHKPYLHTKMYLSDRGLIVGSANASDNGIGFGGRSASHTEVGVFDEPETEAWRVASEWFETTYSGAAQIDREALELARNTYVPTPRAMCTDKVRKGSLFDRVMAHPELFNEVGFLVIDIRASAKEVETAKRKAIDAGIASERSIARFKSEDMITRLSQKEMASLPSTFVEIYSEGGQVEIFYRTIWRVDQKSRNIFTRKDEKAVQRLARMALPSRSVAAKADAALVRKLCLANGAGLYTSGRYLAERLSSLSS